MDSYRCNQSHPYGVKPPGNAYFEDNAQILNTRSIGLGNFRSLSDEILLEFLSFLSAESLVKLIGSSRAFYVFCHHSDLWRDLTLKEWNGKGIDFTCSWKDTFGSMFCRLRYTASDLLEPNLPIYTPHQPLKINGIYSGVLHQSWACHACDFSGSCPGFFKHSDITRCNHSELSVDDFVANYESKNIPVVILNAVNDWPALTKWTKEYLIEQCGERMFRATSATAPLAANFTIRQYFQYASETREEAPLYLFDRDFISHSNSFSQEYSVPAYFTHDCAHGTDLFRVFGEERRPDYHWLIAGPARSGSIFHIDPNQTNAWNVCVQGRKKWIFYPPGVNPPGVVSSEDGADVTVPISTGEWLLSFWKYHLEARKNPDPALRPLETILSPGEVIFVPHGYWHMVVNLDDCVALTHNYVSTSNLTHCLRFLREKVDQISGVRDRLNTVHPEAMYEEFIDRLKDVIDPARLQASVLKSLEKEDGDSIDFNRMLRSRSNARKRKAHFDAASSADLNLTPLVIKQEAESFSFSFDV